LCFNGVFDTFVSQYYSSFPYLVKKTGIFLAFNTLILFLLLSSRASDFHISHTSNLIELI